jgi:hypothetical protein
MAVDTIQSEEILICTWCNYDQAQSEVSLDANNVVLGNFKVLCKVLWYSSEKTKMWKFSANLTHRD